MRSMECRFKIAKNGSNVLAGERSATIRVVDLYFRRPSSVPAGRKMKQEKRSVESRHELTAKAGVKVSGGQMFTIVRTF